MNNNSSLESITCTKCGISLNKSSKFCTSCGENLQVQAKTPSLNKPEIPALQNELKGSSSVKSSKALLILAIFVSFVMAAIYAIAQMSKGNNASVNEKSSESLISAKQSTQPLATHSLRKLAELCGSVPILNKTILSVMY